MEEHIREKKNPKLFGEKAIKRDFNSSFLVGLCLFLVL